jgi:uncharacterized protein (TIGR00730 family)
MKNNSSREEFHFLKGPRARWKELSYTFGVLLQFIKGFRALHFAGPCITFFGSARLPEKHPYYIKTRELAAEISKMGFTIMTGGGPGIMEAANRGAKDANGRSIGCNIVLPTEQKPNPYLDKFVYIDYFFVRKELLRKYSCAFIVMPGGFGTMDEFFETLTLIQTKKTENFPLILFGVDFYKDLISQFDKMKAVEAISEEELKYVLFTDSIDEAKSHIEKYVSRKAELMREIKIKPIPIFGEKAI